MKAEMFDRTLTAFRRAVPFRPFTVALVNGDRFEVDHPEALVVRKGRGLFIGPEGVPVVFDHEGVAQVVGDLMSQPVSKGSPMGRFVIVAYSPKPGKADALLDAVRKHLQVLRAEDLVTDHPASVMRAADGTIVEVFEWRSAEAIAKAHSLPAVHALWAEFGAACDYRPLHTLVECQQMFAEFVAVEV